MVRQSRLKSFFKMTPTKYILISFAAIILVGAFLLCLPISNTDGKWIPFVDSLFTSTSAVCVTGLAVFDVAAEFTLFGQIIVLLLIQVGGLGFVTLTTFLFVLVGKKINYSTRMALQESLNHESNQGVLKIMLKVLIITFSCEFIGFLMLAPSMIQFSGNFWSGVFKALFLAISAFCNAGVDSLGSSTPNFSNLMAVADKELILIPLMLLIVMGGIGFIVILDVFRKDKKQKKMMLHTRVVLWVTGILILVGAGMFMILEWNNPNTLGGFSTGDKIVNAFFQSITTRTAGFATVDQAALNPVSQVLSGFLMFVGGSPASIAGGIKTTTLFILLLMLFRNTDKNGNIIYKNKKIKNSLLSKAVRITLIAVVLVTISSMAIFVIEGGSYSFGTIVFETLSAICTVGLSFGITPFLSVYSKLILSLLMYTGRIGMLTIPLAFKTKEYSAEIEYVEAKITVG